MLLGIKPFGWWNNCIAYFNHPSFNDLNNETTKIKERLFETFLLATDGVWAIARIAVLHATKLCSPNLEIFSDKPHQLNVHSDDVAQTFRIVEATSIKEDSVDESNLPPALIAFVETALAGTIAVSFQTSSGNCFKLPRLLAFARQQWGKRRDQSLYRSL